MWRCGTTGCARRAIYHGARTLVDAWAEKNKVDVQLDFLTAIGNKINITMAAEAQAKTGHVFMRSICGR